MKIGFCNGCFDLFHDGHQHFLRECDRQCDYLIVAVNSSKSVELLKGVGRPFESLETRMGRVISFSALHLKRSAAVIPFEGAEEPLILQIRPHVVFKGEDHSPNMAFYAQRVPGWKNGPAGVWRADVIHVTRLPGISTTLIAQRKERESGQGS